MGEGAGAVDGLEWVQRQAMKMIKGREGLIYKTRLEEQGCPAWLRDSSQAGGWAGGVREGGVAVRGGEPSDSEGPTSPGAWAGPLPGRMTSKVSEGPAGSTTRAAPETPSGLPSWRCGMTS